MSATTLAELAVKLWGVFAILDAAVGIPMTLSLYVQGPPGIGGEDAMFAAAVRSQAVNLVATLLAGIVVLVWADRIVAWFESDTRALDVPVTARQAQSLALAIVGVFLVVSGLQSMVLPAFMWFRGPSDIPIDVPSYLSSHAVDFAKAAIELVAGIGLIAGRHVLVGGWRRLRAVRGRMAPGGEL